MPIHTLSGSNWHMPAPDRILTVLAMQNGCFWQAVQWSPLAARGLEQEDGGDLECLVSTVAGSQEAQSGQSMVRSVEIDITVKGNLS